MTELTPEHASIIAGFLLPQIEEEVRTSAKILAAVPEDKKSYSPDPKSMNAGVLAEHIALSDVWFLEGVANVGFGAHPEPSNKPIADLVADYQANVAEVLGRIKKLSAEDLAKPVKFYMWELPNVMYLQLMQKHMVHHRGQLSAYLRPMGAKVPGIYGGSADEPVTAAAGEGN